MADINEEFSNVDWKNTGIINNIQFFVLWRELEVKWLRSGQILMVLTDRQMGFLFTIFDEFNANTKGVTLEEFLECRSTINKMAQGKPKFIETYGAEEVA